MKRIRFGFFWVLCLVNSFCSIAQRHNVKNYTTREGLPGQIVNGVFQDQTGYLWFATQSGVCHFNGRNFQHFEPNTELTGVDAVCVNQDKTGNIWIGTNANGLFRYDFKTTKNYNESNGFPSNVVRSIFFDKDSTLWAVTSKGVAKFKNNKFQAVNDPQGTFKKGVLSMTQSKDGALWFGTQGNGLVKLKNGNFTYFDDSDGLLDNYIFSLNTFGDSILIGTTNQGLLIYHSNQFSKLKVPEIENAWISNVIIEKERLSIVTSSGLVRYLNPSNYTVLTEENGLASNDLYFGLKDRENNIWLTSGNGVSCLRNEEILSFDKNSGLSDQKITCLTALSNGTMLIGTYGFGLNLLDKNGNVIKQITHPELMNVKITTIAEIKGKNEIWIGAETSNDGIVVLDSKNNSFELKRTITKINGREPQTVTKISVDKKGQVWIGTFNAGLFLIRESDTLHYGKQNLLPSNEVYTFIIDNDGNPWVSLYQKGVFKFEGSRFNSISEKFKLKDKFVLSMDQDENGIIYIGHKNAGLSIIFENKVYSFSKLDGLLSNAIQSVVVDNQRTVWLGTDQGLNKLKLNDKFEIVKLESYNDKSGLINSEIQQNALLLTQNNVWIGSSSGLSRLQKVSKNRSNVKPILELESIKLFFEATDWAKKEAKVDKWGVPTELNLGYKENHLTFSFNALTATQVQYAYILEGQDDNWTPFSDKNEITFSNIAPGSYTFKVKAINNFGIESEPLEIPIIVRSPYWQTWWFRITVVILIIIIIFAVVRYRERRYLAQEETLKRMVEDRTKEAVSASERAENQKRLVEQKNKEILDSISYAKRIQTAMLPNIDVLRESLPQLTVFYKPKDIVAGDFYWFEETKTHKMLAVADCTGHGVPGAIVSVVCHNALNRSVREYGLVEPGKILDKTREIILSELSKHDENVKDGMDISLVVIENSTSTLKWAGANNPLWVLKNGSDELQEIKGDKQPIGMHIHNNLYVTHTFEVQENDQFMMFTDGYSDQFGGEGGKKFKSANLKRLFLETKSASIFELEQKLVQTFESWMGTEEQVDDVCVIVFRV